MPLHDPILRRLRSLLFSSGVLFGLLLTSGQAQVTTTITPDGTMNTTVTRSGTIHDITGGTRPANGPNLYHSFDRFSVGTNDTARFSGPTGIVNILSRVTGGQQSIIDGRLQSTIPGANLYLLNPSGVLFGPNASLDISGSFHVSTADVLRFADGAIFSAHIGEKSTLTTAPPVAFGFLGPTPAAIAVQGSSLGVSEGKAMSVVGGEIQIVGGQFVAPSGRVHIASVASPGEVLVSPVEMEPNLQVNAFTRLGPLTLSQNALLNVSGNSGGTVIIRSGRLLVDQSSILADTVGNTNGARQGIDIAVTEDMTHTRGGFITAGSVSTGDAGNVQITARSLHVDGALIGAGTFMEGRAGDIRIDVGTLTLTQGAVIDSSTFAGARRGGTVTVTATDSITIAGQDSLGNASGLFANALGNGDAGHMMVVTPTLAIDGGKIQAVSSTSGNAGNITLDVGRLTLTGGAQIGSNSFGAGRGGTITVMATDTVSLAANAQIDASGAGGGTVVIQSGRLLVDQSTIMANTRGGAHSSSTGIDLEVRDSIVLTQNAAITAASFGAGDASAIRIVAHSLGGTDNAFIGAGTSADGNAGDIHIDVGTLTLAHRAVIDSSTFGHGAAGHVTIIAPTLELPGGRIRASTEGAGNAGTIAVEAGHVSLTEGGQIFSNTSSMGQGGTVTVTASDGLHISGQSSAGNASGLFSNSTGSGNAGRVAIVTPVFEMIGGQLQAVSTGEGNAGAIEVHAGRVMLSGAAQLDSSAGGSGRGGTVSVTATDTLSLAANAQIDTSGAGGGTVIIRGSTLLVDHASISAQSGGDVDGAGIGIDIMVAEAIRLTQGGAISTTSYGAGKAGDLRIMAGSVHMAGAMIAAEAFGAGRAGDIVMNVGTLTLTPGAKINSTTTGTGQGGDIVVTATQGMTIAGAHNMDNPLDLAGLFAGTFGRGNAGRVAITTPTFTLQGFASISPSTFNEGNAGSVEIAADRVILAEGGSIFSNTQGPGQGGTVTITARESLSLQNGGRLSISAFDRGNAGRVSLTTPNLVMQGGLIEAKAEGTGGNAGTIVVNADRMTLTEGAVIDSSTQGAGRGGAISIRGGSLIMDGAFINALTRGDMAGGSIDIRLTDALDMRNAGAILAATFGAGRGGDVTVEAGHLTLTGGAEINGTTNGSGPGGDINVTAHNSLSILGRSSTPFLSLSGLATNALADGPAGRVVVIAPTINMDDGIIQALTVGKGSAGDIQINVGSLTLTGGAQILSSSGATSLAAGALTSAIGQGGNVTITATDSVTISGRSGGFPSGVFADTSGSGNAGHTALSTPILHMQDGGITSATTGDGHAGDIMLHVGRLTLADGAQISSASGNPAGAVGSGQGGEVTIMADEAIAISGRGSTISSNTFGIGDAGNISLTTSTLRMDNEGTIEAGGAEGRAGDIRIGATNVTLTGGATINTSTTGAGLGGNVIVTAADLISVSGRDANGVSSGFASGTLGSGVGGNIALQAQRLELNDEGTISALSLGTGDAGNIMLQAGKTFRSRHGAVTAEAEQGNGGNIQLTVGSLAELRDSQITATVKTGVGKGGNILIDPQFVILQRSQVRADAFGGPGGNVRIVAGVFLADPASQVSASSALGINGVVNIQAPVTSLSGAVAPLPQEFAAVAALLRDRCAGRLREGRVSRLVLGGRDGVPSEPGSLLLSPLMQTNPRENGERTGRPARAGQVQEQAWPAQAGTLEGLEAECARWTGQRAPTVRKR